MRLFFFQMRCKILDAAALAIVVEPAYTIEKIFVYASEEGGSGGFWGRRYGCWNELKKVF